MTADDIFHLVNCIRASLFFFFRKLIVILFVWIKINKINYSNTLDYPLPPPPPHIPAWGGGRSVIE